MSRVLKTRFSQGDHFWITDLQEQIYTLIQGSQSVIDFFTRLKTLWDEFIRMRPNPQCVCDPLCNCGADRQETQYQQEDQIISFLKGLNDNSNTIRSQIILLQPLPDVDKAFALAL